MIASFLNENKTFEWNYWKLNYSRKSGQKSKILNELKITESKTS